MENENNQSFRINESDELTKQKILNSALIKELRKYHKKEKLQGSQIERPVTENKTMINQNPHEETMEIVQNILVSNHEFKEEPLTQKTRELWRGPIALQKTHNCESCSNFFSDEDDLKLHMKVKHGKISHKCEFCGNTFSDEEDLSMHTNIKHKKISCKCQYCDHTFSDKEDLSMHKT